MHWLLREWRAWAYHVATPVHCPRGWLLVTEAPGISWQVMLASRAEIQKAILEMGPPCLEVMSLPGGVKWSAALVMSPGRLRLQFHDDGKTRAQTHTWQTTQAEQKEQPFRLKRVQYQYKNPLLFPGGK